MWWAALRYRRGQSVALVLVSTFVTACAVFAPMFVRTLEQGLLRVTLLAKDPADTTVSVRALRTPENPALSPADLLAVLPSSARTWFESGIGMTAADARLAPEPGLQTSPVRLVARDGVCEHITLSGGRCPSAAGEVLVSVADARRWGWTDGATLSVQPVAGRDVAGGPGQKAEVPLAVVGAYTVQDAPAYWLRTQLDGKSGFPVSEGLNIVPAVDDLITSEETLDDGWAHATVSTQFPLRTSELTLSTLPRVSEALSGLGSPAEGVSVESPVPALVASVADGQRLVRGIVPLLLAQLALLAVTVLALVAHFAVNERRPEIALSRLRGRSRAASRRIVVRELSVTVLIGVPLGVAAAELANEVLKRSVMPAGIPFETGWLVLLAAGLALAASLVTVVLVTRPVLREPVASLLRQVPPSTRRGLSAAEASVVAIAGVAVLGLLTGGLQGPTALLVPAVLAGAFGLLGSVMVRAVAASAGRTALERGRLVGALAALSVARRPALVSILVIVSTATALATFSASAVVVGERNRAARAELELGAPAVLETEAASPTSLVAAVDGLGEEQRDLVTPVVVVRPRDPTAVPTLLARPQEMSRVGFPLPGLDSADLAALTPPVVPSLRLEDGTITGSASWQLRQFLPGGDPARPVPPDQSGAPRGDVVVEPQPLRLGITVTMPTGEVLDRDLLDIPQDGRAGRADLRAAVLCPDSCRLAGIWVRSTDPWIERVTGRIRLTGLSLNGRPLEIGGSENWLPPGDDAAVGTQRVSGVGRDLVLDIDNTGRKVTSYWADVPVPAPVILAGRPPADARGDDFSLVGLGGRPFSARAVSRVAALPVVGGRGALADLDAALRQGGEASAGSSPQVWVATPDRAVLASVAKGLAAAGAPVVSTTTVAQLQAAYDRSATGWGLLLGVFTGAMALLVAALVVVVVGVTSWRVVARDQAGLLVAGVPRRTLRAAVRREQLSVVTVAVALGTACGVAGCLLAMPLIPLFDRPTGVPTLQLEPAWWTVAAASLLSLAVVGGASLLAGRSVLARAVPARLRESA